MDSTGVCSFLTNPVMELSCCIKGSQRLFTAVLKDLSLMKAAVIQVPTECLSYLLRAVTLCLEIGARVIAFRELVI